MYKKKLGGCQLFDPSPSYNQDAQKLMYTINYMHYFFEFIINVTVLLIYCFKSVIFSSNSGSTVTTWQDPGQICTDHKNCFAFF